MQERRKLCRASFEHVGMMLAETCALLLSDPARMLSRVSVEGLEHLTAAATTPGGVLMLTAHFGNWELLGLAHTLSGLPLTVVVLPVLFEREVKAVVELASFQQLSEVHLAFLDQLTESMGIVLNTIAATMRTEQLLQQSQALAEELQKTNAELQEKAQLLAEQNTEVEAKNREIEQAKQALEENLAPLHEPLRKSIQQALDTKEKERPEAMKALLKTNAALVLEEQRTKRIWVKAGVAGINGRTATQ